MLNLQSKNRRRSLRLQNYDYSQSGFYFITICIKDYLCLLGKVVNGEMMLNDAGRMVQSVWNEIPNYYDGFNVNKFVVMPNHFHGIIEIVNNSDKAGFVGAGPCACPESVSFIRSSEKGQPQGVAPTYETMSLSDIVHRFKTLTTKKYIDGVIQHNWQRFNKKLWQRNYYEHIIRSETSYLQISEYIQNNPLKWREDKLFVNQDK